MGQVKNKGARSQGRADGSKGHGGVWDSVARVGERGTSGFGRAAGLKH